MYFKGSGTVTALNVDRWRSRTAWKSIRSCINLAILFFTEMRRFSVLLSIWNRRSVWSMRERYQLIYIFNQPHNIESHSVRLDCHPPLHSRCFPGDYRTLTFRKSRKRSVRWMRTWNFSLRQTEASRRKWRNFAKKRYMLATELSNVSKCLLTITTMIITIVKCQFWDSHCFLNIFRKIFSKSKVDTEPSSTKSRRRRKGLGV